MSAPIPVIHLIGDSLENFYQLGLKDRGSHSDLLIHAHHLIKSPWTVVNKAFLQVVKSFLRVVESSHPEFYKKSQAYSEGLGRDTEEVLYALLMPEIISFMDKWVPGIPHSLLGCSSYFLWDDKRNCPAHGRILDFPLVTSFDTQERIVISKLDNGPKMVSLNSSGFPYPSLTTMTEEGITFALHQKFTNDFDRQGTPIFELVFRMLQESTSKKSLLAFLKKNKTITRWGLYISFSDGEVLEIDMAGDQLFTNEFHLEPGKVLYFNNDLVGPEKKNQDDFLPLGLTSYNQMRSHQAQEKIKDLKKGKSLNAEKLIRSMGTIHTGKSKSLKTKAWKLDPLTPSSLQSSVLCPSQGEVLLIPGAAPKFFNNELVQLSHSWEKEEVKLIKLKGKTTPEKYQKGHRHLILAQVGFDLGDWHEAYHHVQLAMIRFKGLPEEDIAFFFLLVFQYIHETHDKVKSQVLSDFRELFPKLPPYLADHALLFISRLEKIILGKTVIAVDEIQNHHLQRVFSFEMKLPQFLFHKTTSVMINPRIDLLDVIYAHVRTN
jgi:hypothetical protein